jgi:hypothetical protein
MNTIIIAAILAFSATASAQSYNNDYVRSMDNTQYQIYDRTQRQIEQSDMNRRQDEQMQEQLLQRQSMDRSRREMESNAIRLNSLLR